MNKTIAFVLFVLLPAAAWAQSPRWVRLSYGDGDAATSMTVSWNADAAMDPAKVRYGLSDSYGDEITGTSEGPLPGSLGYVHEVTLTDLSPSTTYHYSAGTDGAWSVDAVFKTAPADGCEPFTAVVLGDGRSQDESGADAKWDDILVEAWAHDPLFVLDTGDLIKSGDQATQWADWMTKTDVVNPNLPHMPAIGNHDSDVVEGDGAMYNRLFSLPRNEATNTEDFYAFTVGNAVFAVISTETYKDDSFVTQAEWLDATLTAHADKKWKIVSLHHPIYTSHAGYFGIEFNHPPNERGQNAALVPVIDAHHVDIVFAGHNHYYERFEPLQGGGGADEGNVASSFADGTVYVVTGGAGAFTYDEFDLFGLTIDLVDWLCGDNGQPARGSTACSGRHHYVVLDFDDNKLTYTAQTTTLQNFGSETPWVIETFEITKPRGSDCQPVEPDGGQPDAGPAGDANIGDPGVGDSATAGDPGAAGDAAIGPGPAQVGGCECTASGAGLWFTGALLVWWRRRRGAMRA